MGTGKTVETLTLLLDKFAGGKIKNALIVCPLAVIGAWESDMKLFGEAAQRHFKEITVINYDKLIYRKEIQKKRFDAIVCDESHLIANRKSQRAKVLMSMIHDDQYRYILTGTPIGNGRMEDYYSQLAWLLGASFPFRSLKEFLDTYFTFDLAENRTSGSRFYQNIICNKPDALMRFVRGSSTRYDKSVLSNLAEPLPAVVHSIELSTRNSTIYKKMRKDQIVVSDKIDGLIVSADRTLTLIVRLRQLASHIFSNGEHQEIVGDEKVNALMSDLESRGILRDGKATGAGDKTVIFVDFVESQRAITNMLRRCLVNFDVMGDGITGSERWQNFQSNDKVKVFVGNYRSIGVGVNLSSADMAIFYEPTQSSQQNEQAKSRLWRNGQKGQCSFVYYIAKGTIEELIYSRLQRFEDFNKAMFEEYLNTE